VGCNATGCGCGATSRGDFVILRRIVSRIVDSVARKPWLTVLVTIALLVAALLYCRSNLEVRTGLLELLPSDSPGLVAFEQQRERVGGGASLIVVVESPDRLQNRRFIDDLGARLRDRAKDRGSRIAYVEAGTQEVRRFYEEDKWLYPTVHDLEDLDEELDRRISRGSGMVEDLGDDEPPGGAPPPGRAPGADTRPAFERDLDRLEKEATSKDPYPNSYFESSDGTLVALRVVANVTLGEAAGDALVADVRAMVASLDPHRYDPRLAVGLTGEIASTAAEKSALMNSAVWATLAAAAVILAGVVLYFRSLFSLVIIGMPAIVGVAAAYAFATFAYGYVNMVGAFLGAIVLGNGINYPIVLLSRYQEFRARGMPPAEARVDAVVNAFRAELVGACVAAIAYGSLAITDFRGFRQFGVVGFVGMLLVWASIVPLVPALLVLSERLQPRLPAILRDRPGAFRPDGGRGPVLRFVAKVTTRHPWVFVAAGLAATAYAAIPLRSFARDPWEYDFGRLGSRSTDVHSYGWSDKADVVFGGKANIAGALVLADTPEQAPAVAKQILANDAADRDGSLIESVTTIADYLPGTPDEQRAKIAILERIKGHLGASVLSDLGPRERAQALILLEHPPFHLVGAADLPDFIKRRFTERDGRLGAVMYVKPRNEVILADGHNQLRLSRDCDNVRLSDGTVVHTASNATIVAEILRSLRSDGPRVTIAALLAVTLVVLVATRNLRGAFAVLASLAMGVVVMLGMGARMGLRIHYVNFIALPITCGIGAEYPFNVYDRTRLLGGDVVAAVVRSAGAVLLCSFTTAVGYASLLLSDVQALESFGKLAVSGEAACAFAAVFFLPSLVTLLSRGRPQPPGR
jgi:predicted RND superfamily exporter protein